MLHATQCSEQVTRYFIGPDGPSSLALRITLLTFCCTLLSLYLGAEVDCTASTTTPAEDEDDGDYSDMPSLEPVNDGRGAAFVVAPAASAPAAATAAPSLGGMGNQADMASMAKKMMAENPGAGEGREDG